ncbi:unnamed protein product [Linum tenue]|uniref:Uncharacterized protein n=1 Tax=Linum tenue TaxID=586396 RepID=A0AAV0KS88_9ROSI|nr:unnamed protein product [Linum tenue]
MYFITQVMLLLMA